MVVKRRRGVLLLVVLALLAMFAMVAVAFVVLTGTERQVAERLRTIDAVKDTPEKTLGQAFNVVVRGSYCDLTPPSNPSAQPATPTSAIKWCSLLEKFYGDQTIGTLASSATMSINTTGFVSNGQVVEFNLQTMQGKPLKPTKINVELALHSVGCVLTMLDGPNAGLSTRIVGINPVTYSLQMLAFEGGVQITANNVNLFNGNRCIVNGFPYSGMGFGFLSPATGATNSSGTLTQLALYPNRPPKNWNTIQDPNNTNPNGQANYIIDGSVNSDYTAADFQDPLVALAVPSPYNSNGVIVPIPSLHRSDLISYMKPTDANGLRQVMFRPVGANCCAKPDHPNFTGSNPNFNPLWDGITSGQGQWDVDNDGDGVPDSVWVDLGMPVRFTSDGRAYKPLFAILCLDMDGRLNLNAHGSLAQTSTAYYQPTNATDDNQKLTSLDVNMGKTPFAMRIFAGPTGSTLTAPQVVLSRGQGTGPAEVNLLPLFRNPVGSSTFDWNAYKWLLSGSTRTLAGSVQIPGRYGMSAGTSDALLALPGLSGSNAFAVSFSGSYLTFNNAFPYNAFLGQNYNYWNCLPLPTPFPNGKMPPAAILKLDDYGSPPDTQAMGAVGLDRAGRPLWISMGGQISNSPYDIDLTRNAPHCVDQANCPDDPFGPAEFERILRCFDRDVPSLPQRLNYLTSGELQSRRAEVTTESWSVPCASAVLPPALRAALPDDMHKRSQHPIDLIYGKIRDPKLITQLLPWEILQGLKMDLNRPFGNGACWNKNTKLTSGASQTLPDQPDAPVGQFSQYYNSTTGTVGMTCNYAADGLAVSRVNNSAVQDPRAARQLYARHLYCMALALSDTNAILNDIKGSSGQDVARFLAQWAVNVVAFRDNNSIMIPFHYDVNPFDPATGWNPETKDKTGADVIAHTVWGCKRPDLLITETLAFHDRRTTDEADESVDDRKQGNQPGRQPGTTKDSGKKLDPSFNSLFRPQGSLFVELHNPWSYLQPCTADLAFDSTAGSAGVRLTKVTPPLNGKSSPVWRLIIVDPTKQTWPTPPVDEFPDPDDSIVANRPKTERAVYFVNITGQNIPPSDAQATNPQVSYCPSPGNAQELRVTPGGYAVIGSADSATAQGKRTYLGFDTGQTSGNNTRNRMVTLNLSPDLASDPRVVQNTNDTSPRPSYPAPGVLAIDMAKVGGGSLQQQRLSISEPAAGYKKYETTGKNGSQSNPVVTYDPASGKYKSGGKDKPIDIPVDEQRFMFPQSPDTDQYFGSGGNKIALWDTSGTRPSILNMKGTTPGYRIIYLQRLADPTRPWVADTDPNNQTNPSAWNPYRTIDAMTVDLTAFNGASSTSDNTTYPRSGDQYHFESRQRGEKNWWTSNLPPSPNRPTEWNLWKQEPAIKGLIAPNPVKAWAAPAGWNDKIFKSSAPKSANSNFKQALIQSLGCLNLPYDATGTPAFSPTGDSLVPFPWLNWSYRPFNNEYELLMVPTASSSRLLARSLKDPMRYYGYMDLAKRNATNPPNAAGLPNPVAAMNPYDGSSGSQVPFPHLLNFFESRPSGASAQLHRLFAYVGVPSRFANTQVQIYPDLIGGGPQHYFHAPFNHISRYREPGRINLNTVTSSDVFYGALNMYCQPIINYWSAAPLPTGTTQSNPDLWDKFVRARRGSKLTQSGVTNPNTIQSMLGIDGKFPSRFMRPFRTPGGAALTATAGWSPANQLRETDMTLLCGDPDSVPPGPNGLTTRPLFEFDDPLAKTPVVANQTPDQFATKPQGKTQPVNLACMDFNRNPYFRYQAIEKLGSVFSNHSNVFAIWITVGYFEVTRVSDGINDDAHPDGYALGQELGSDTGDIVRHRAFYLFDRSIPVGFIRGQDINHDKAILLKRFIE